jgi:hypothetical protein
MAQAAPDAIGDPGGAGLLKTIRDRIARRRRDHSGMKLALLLEHSRT